MIKAIIFDFDGVIVESIDIKTKAFAKLFESEGEEIIKKIVKYHLENGGVSRFEKFRYIYQSILCRPLEEKIFEELCDKFSSLVKEAVIKVPYVRGAREFIESYEGQYLYFINSAIPTQELQEIMRRRNIDFYFRKIYGSPDKKAEVVKKILANQFKSEETIYVGDALSDYEAAYLNNVYFVARIHEGNNHLFKDLNCPRIKDLSQLSLVIEGLAR